MSRELPTDDIQEEGEMSFLEHLEVLRWHLVRSVSAIFIVAIAAFIAKDFLFDTLLLGPKSGDFWTYRMLCKYLNLLCMDEMPFDLINISMSGQFTTHIMVSMIAGFVVAFPYIVFEPTSRPIAPAPVFAGGGKPSTRKPPGELAEQLGSPKSTKPTKDKVRDKAWQSKKINILNSMKNALIQVLCMPNA